MNQIEASTRISGKRTPVDFCGVVTLVRALARLRSEVGAEQVLLDELMRLLVSETGVRVDQLQHKAVHVNNTRDKSPNINPTQKPLGFEGQQEAHRQSNKPSKPVIRSEYFSSQANPVIGAPQKQSKQLVSDVSKLTQIFERADFVAPSHEVPKRNSPANTPLIDMSAVPKSLLAPKHIRGILREMIAFTAPVGLIDIHALVSSIGKASSITSLPRKHITLLGRGITWLFDVGPSMLPFANDKQELAINAARILGRDPMHIADFMTHPFDGVRQQHQVLWHTLKWPDSGCTMVVVSDLGIGSFEGESNAKPWREFIKECRHRRLRSVAIIPYERTRWPTIASEFDCALTWDTKTGVQELRRLRRRTHKHL